jgi:hypothetical protein
MRRFGQTQRTRRGMHSAAVLASVIFTACANYRLDSSSDSQGHWLMTCEDDTACGGVLSCVCGVCSSLCSDELDCPQVPGMAPACIPKGALSNDCTDLAAGDSICTARCQGDWCDGDLDGDGDSAMAVARPNGFIPSDAAPVPACPELAPTTGLPPFFLRTEMNDYDGSATVNQVTENDAVVLVPNGVVGGHFELRFNQPPPAFLRLGLRVNASFRRVGESNAEARLLVVRSEDGTLLLAHHSGGDGLYQSGLFEDASMFGAAIELTMACQSSVAEGCFVNQVQAEYRGEFRADTVVTLESPSIGELMIAQRPYRLDFSSSSVDGDGIKQEPFCNSDIVPARYLHVDLLLVE